MLGGCTAAPDSDKCGVMPLHTVEGIPFHPKSKSPRNSNEVTLDEDEFSSQLETHLFASFDPN